MRRTASATAALAATLALFGAGCGGTLEGKYRRGQLTTSTTTGPRTPGTNAPASPTPSSAPAGQSPATTSTTVATSGNAVRAGRPG